MVFCSMRRLCLSFGFWCLVGYVSVAVAAEPLKVFVLAGQSNMVGHARAHTVATLFASENPRDRELLEMILADEHGLSVDTLNEQLARGKELDQLTGGISNDKLKQMEEGPEKEKLVARVEALKTKHEQYKKMVSEKCVVSNRVYIHSIADRNQQSGPLRIGCGASTDKIGPEYGFGLSIEEQVTGPILIIKTSWGGKSLNYNFRPPSAETYELNEKEKSGDKAEQIAKDAGLNYRMMMESVGEVLQNLSDFHPQYEASVGYEVSGFVWFQGFNDQFRDDFREGYQANMIRFIQDVRKDLQSPKMPFVIGVLGTGVTAEKVGENAVSVAQREAAKEMGIEKGVVSVESYTQYSHYSNEVFQRGWPAHYHEWDTVGSDRPYHYLGSGAFFVRLGDAFADAMVDLIKR